MSKRISKIIDSLEITTKDMEKTLIDKVNITYGKDPFLILISCLLSLRSRDLITFNVCKKLFARARNVHELSSLSVSEIRDIIKSINFYKTKADTISRVSNRLIKEYNGKVPNIKKELLSFKGIGIKTANLVLGQAFNIPSICVDTHVHRISNKHGLINTKTPEETEKALEKIVPKDKWIKFNKLLVLWGQNICLPRSKQCKNCSIFDL